MFSKTFAAVLLAAGCVTAAGAAAYFGVRQNAAPPAPAAAATVAEPADAPRAVAETEAIIAVPDPVPVEAPRPEVRPGPVTRPPAAASRRSSAAKPGPAAASRPAAPAPPAAAPAVVPEPMPVEPVAAALLEPLRVADPPAAPERRFEELVIPSSSVIGLQVETPISSERARVEDRVDARVTRDVLSAGRVAIPAGSRVIGAVTLVERGGKVKERARLGVRFHTVVLADGGQVPLSTEAIIREGDAPSGESARKIGGAAVGGAILGAIMGGKKGAVIGGATGAGAGTAAVMAGDRNAATLPAGTIVTVRLSSPAYIEVERR